ncbi:DUF6007 family protein [Staphylococcus sp. NRL 16/872]|uniref:DUF6007 family protein n=1 Tax=Staphylococcus sp. NRL 16/872 TaxID=2930131 RepID=UPI001FB40BFD|nr:MULTISPECIES: DUF6007 family protein [unclassified Staphylococcus]MCJ1657009.1 DUF6007 family protein [Staphylococcus sp. NRL 21/187]MCJ1662756.1 DUF6007 family protein [Staphylococcus sp. NRL 18/288]MCJ1668865.1 DUF6007 family protein [Staphylococcus sp. NRL 19/737]WEN69081.1 DUF6007 family protein [Staphylococcus sp. NRL 16/872]
MNNLKTALNFLAWWDIIFVVPMFLLFSYLPTYNIFSIVLNVLIILFTSIGLILTVHSIIAIFKRGRDKNV